MYKVLFLALAAALAGLVIAPRAQAWGAYHVGYTHVGPSGAYHYGSTGYSSGTRVGGYGGAYAAGGFRAGGVYGGAYRAGVYRRW